MMDNPDTTGMGPIRVHLHPKARQLVELSEAELNVMSLQCLYRRIDRVNVLVRAVAA